jgi:hypothetical protein
MKIFNINHAKAFQPARPAGVGRGKNPGIAPQKEN